MKALMLLLLSGILAAGVFILGKQASGEQLSPLLILFWQISGGAVVVLFIALSSRKYPTWDTEHVRYYLVGGLLGLSLPYIFAFIALQVLQVGTVGLLTALSPVITYALARLLGIEHAHPLRLAGLVLGFVGVAILVTPGSSVHLSANWQYMLIALGVPLTLAASNIYRSRFWPAGSAAMPLVLGMLTVQGLILFFLNLLLGNFQNVFTVAQHSGLLLAVLGVIAGASYLSSVHLLKVGGPVYLSQMGYVITTVTLLVGIIIWDEQYESSDLLSMGFILLGVMFTTLTQRVARLKQPEKILAES